MKNRAYPPDRSRAGYIIAVLFLVAFVTTFNYGGCGGSSGGTTSGSSAPSLPAQVTLPNPSNGAENVITTTQLSWASASGATSYDVYFANVSEPTELSGFTTSTTFDPGLLIWGQQYWWRIDSKNSTGTTQGVVWSFTTVSAPTPSAQVTSPNPANGATNIPVTQQLTWASANYASSYDVYFGITTTGWSPVTNTTGTSYNPGGLSYSTIYYWRIDSKNATGTTTGVVWSFQSEAEAVTSPAQVTSPNPTNGATNVPITQQLGWAAASGATSYDVYFGTNPPAYQTNTTGTSYNLGTLSYNTVYYWRIDSNNTAGTTQGVVWSFTTISTPSGDNDMGTGGDVSNNLSAPTTISVPITGQGQLSDTDTNDYYKINVSSATAFNVTLTPPAGADFDLYLYCPQTTDASRYVLLSDR